MSHDAHLVLLAGILLAAGVGSSLPVLAPAVSMAVVGTALTALIAGLAAAWLLNFSVTEGLLLGAILSPTDGAAGSRCCAAFGCPIGWC